MKTLFYVVTSMLAISVSAHAGEKAKAMKSEDAQAMLRTALLSHAETDSSAAFVNGTTSDGRKCVVTISGFHYARDMDSTGFDVLVEIPSGDPSVPAESANFDLDNHSAPGLMTNSETQIVMSQNDVHQQQKLYGAMMGSSNGYASVNEGIVLGADSEYTIKDLIQMDGADGKITSIKITNARSKKDVTEITCGGL